MAKEPMNVSKYQRKLAALGKRIKKSFDGQPGLNRLDGPIRSIEQALDYLDAKEAAVKHRVKTEDERRAALAEAREQMLESARDGGELEVQGGVPLVAEDEVEGAADVGGAEDEVDPGYTKNGQPIEMGTGGVMIPDSVGNPMVENSEQ